MDAVGRKRHSGWYRSKKCIQTKPVLTMERRDAKQKKLPCSRMHVVSKEQRLPTKRPPLLDQSGLKLCGISRRCNLEQVACIHVTPTRQYISTELVKPSPANYALVSCTSCSQQSVNRFNAQNAAFAVPLLAMKWLPHCLSNMYTLV